ncbi:MAG: helix-turn-helix transcriptional regulator [Ruminococcaceae bacterium]|nr:helix-turn-helix transcriptional regulator [Oscillospiraceae bacterium]
MKFSDIRPFVRYARYMTLAKEEGYRPSWAGDARLFFCISGEGEIAAAGDNFKMKTGSLIIINSGIEYEIKSPENHVSYIALNFDYTDKNTHLHLPIPPRTDGEFSSRDIIENIKFSDAPEIQKTLFLPEMHSLSSRLEHLVREYSMRIIFNEIKTSALLAEVLLDAIRSARSETVLGGGGRLDAIVWYIHEHYREPLTNELLGEHFGFHKNYISVIVKEYTGMPLHKYLNHVRISHALDMLNDSDAPIAEIAEKCGFCDIYYFSRYFKQAVGVSPTEYRRNR